MDQRPTGGEWEFQIDKWVEPKPGFVGDNRVYAIINMLPPGGTYRIKVAVTKIDGKCMIRRYFRPPYVRGENNHYRATELHGQHIKLLPVEGKRTIRKAYPLAVLML
jgi:hypothetical protein